MFEIEEWTELFALLAGYVFSLLFDPKNRIMRTFAVLYSMTYNLWKYEFLRINILIMARS
jgi:hypothetical protein